MRDVYTIADLPTPAGLHPAARLGVIGNPIAHSVSPPMQQAALDADKRGISYVRFLCEREEPAFAELVQQLRLSGFLGANVTVPFKKQARALADTADALSTLCGAANTLVFRDGRVECHNTDGPGFEQAIQELTGRRLSELKTLLLGACGGAGSALAAQCTLSGCPKITLVNRPKPELAQLVATLQPHAHSSELVALPLDSADVRAAVQEADLIVNATSLGLAAEDAPPLRPEWLREGHIVYDLITHDTALQRAAKERGCQVSGGRSMLLWQGAFAYRHWFGEMPPVEAMRSALNAAGA